MGGRGCLQKVMSPHRKNEYRKFLNYSDRHGAKQRPCIENLLGVGYWWRLDQKCTHVCTRRWIDEKVVILSVNTFSTFIC